MTFIKAFITDKYYYHFNIHSNLQILYLWTKMLDFKPIRKFAWQSLNIILKNGTLHGQLEPCLKQLSVCSIKTFKELVMSKDHQNKGDFWQEKVMILCVTNVVFWRMYFNQESHERNRKNSKRRINLILIFLWVRNWNMHLIFNSEKTKLKIIEHLHPEN